jgi:flagellar biosynthesis protein FlhB
VGAVVVILAWPASTVTGDTLEARVTQVSNHLATAAVQVAALIAATCLLDVARRRWSLERSLRMTLDEQREETGKTPATRQHRR